MTIQDAEPSPLKVGMPTDKGIIPVPFALNDA